MTRKNILFQIKKNKNLNRAYKNNDELGKWLKLFFVLRFLPPEKIEEAFDILMTVCPNEKTGSSFSSYFHQKYIKKDGLHPPKVWAEEPTLTPT